MAEDIKVNITTTGQTDGARAVEAAVRDVGEAAGKAAGSLESMGGKGGSGGDDTAARLESFGRLIVSLNMLQGVASQAMGSLGAMREQVRGMAGETAASVSVIDQAMVVLQGTLAGFAAGGPVGAVIGLAGGLIGEITASAQRELDALERDIAESNKRTEASYRAIATSAREAFDEEARAADESSARQSAAADRATEAKRRQIQAHLDLLQAQARTEEELDRVRIARINASNLSEAEKIRATAAVELAAVYRRAEVESASQATIYKDAQVARERAEENAQQAVLAAFAAERRVQELQAASARLADLQAAGQGKGVEATRLVDEVAQLAQAKKRLADLNRQSDEAMEQLGKAMDNMADAWGKMDAKASELQTQFAAQAVGVVDEAKAGITEAAAREAGAFLDQAAAFGAAGSAAGEKVREASSQWKDALARISTTLEDGLQPADYEPIRASLVAMKATQEARNTEQAAQIASIEAVMRDYNTTMRTQADQFLDLSRTNAEQNREAVSMARDIARMQDAIRRDMVSIWVEINNLRR